MPSETKIVAVHESGHAVAYWALRAPPFTAIRLWFDEDGEPRGGVSVPPMRCHPLIKAICCLAGPVAEARLTGVDTFKQPGSVTDIEMAAEALQRLPAARQRRRCRLRVPHLCPGCPQLVGDRTAGAGIDRSPRADLRRGRRGSAEVMRRITPSTGGQSGYARHQTCKRMLCALAKLIRPRPSPIRVWHRPLIWAV